MADEYGLKTNFEMTIHLKLINSREIYNNYKPKIMASLNAHEANMKPILYQ